MEESKVGGKVGKGEVGAGQTGAGGAAGSADIRGDVDAIKSDLKQLRADMRGLLGNLVDAGQTGAKSARGQARAKWDEASMRGRDAASDFEDKLREQPYLTAGVSFGLGLVLGSILFGRRG